jgi:threonine aldolase
MIDLRSDTLTKPTQGMRQAIASAEVGDDVFGEDPTVNLLQDKMASMLGKEAGLFVPSGTMANQVAIKTHIQPGDEIIIDRDAHIYYYECGAAAVISGGQFQCLEGENGILSAEAIAAAIRPQDIHQPPSRLICLENTHNRGGGSIYTLEETTSISEFASSRGIRVHLDGARLFNAALAAGTTVERFANPADSVSICFSKGLGAPVGSVLCGPADFIEEALRYRKMLGGGMRQVGILAAACLYAIENHVERLAEDHDNARKLAFGLALLEAIQIDPQSVVSNIVLFDVSKSGVSADALVERLAAEGVLTIPFGPTTIRGVTHMGVTGTDIDRALEIIGRVLRRSAK